MTIKIRILAARDRPWQDRDRIMNRIVRKLPVLNRIRERRYGFCIPPVMAYGLDRYSLGFQLSIIRHLATHQKFGNYISKLDDY